ncbi:phosphatase PAP2 family protein [Helcobacillus massiliensis]|uniref:phosphatase PAP2 family protein n=1 Tax=Helcobacillus massiliensis TaxID=521392 RepID=UPI0021A513F9|nr:phosphatase PAP2 family protein [Helcobacillus massiliensis]MCT1558068.1 phosphatase PAP2 family protein [Helcobacillus massiliensis]MCT2036633.1 phosphatase PAP2 family protein [Helcobacillus massiliensis]MCT2332493.1 phosphatase PAP2 family protein [Helcobacillus massiliensis]
MPRPARPSPAFSPARLLTGLALIAAALLMGLLTRTSALAQVDHVLSSAAISARTPALTGIAQLFTPLASPLGSVALAAVAVIALVAATRRWWSGLLVIASTSGAGVLTDWLKEVSGRERPPETLRLVHETSPAFPSGHSTGAASLVTAIVLVLVLCGAVRTRRARAALIAAAAAWVVTTALIRIYLGVHWPSDTVGGALVGAGAAIALSSWWPSEKIVAEPGQREHPSAP